MNATTGPGWGGARGVGTAGAPSVAGAGTKAGVRVRAGAGGILDDGRFAFRLRPELENCSVDVLEPSLLPVEPSKLLGVATSVGPRAGA